MLDEQSTKIFAAICGSLDDVEQGRNNIEHISYAINREDREQTIHIIIFRTPPYEDNEEDDEEDEQNEDEDEH